MDEKPENGLGKDGRSAAAETMLPSGMSDGFEWKGASGHRSGEARWTDEPEIIPGRKETTEKHPEGQRQSGYISIRGGISPVWRWNA